MLFDNVSKHELTLSKTADNGKTPTVGYLVKYLCEHLMKDSRKELFVLDEAVYVLATEANHLLAKDEQRKLTSPSRRPGILVLINDSDWELEGEDQYELQNRDNILFVSTLHGG